MRNHFSTLSLLGIGGMLLFGAFPIAAKSLNQVLASTYLTNPALQSARAQLRETDELLAQAISGYWPEISFSAIEGRQQARVDGGSTNSGLPIGLSAQNQAQFTDETLTERQVELLAVLNLYAGGRDAANVNYAKAVISAGQAQLQSSEQEVLADATQAYSDIVFYTRMLNLAADSVKDLLQLKQMTDSLYAKQLATITSSAQVAANLAEARIDYELAQGNLKTARTRYVAVVGEPAPALKQWPHLPSPPETLPAALEIARADNLAIVFAQNMLEASQYSLRINKAALLPVIDLYNSMAWYWDKTRYTNPQDFSENDSERLWSFGVQLQVPLYQGGANYSKIRQSKQDVISKRFDLSNTRNIAEQQVNANWIALSTASSQLKYAIEQIQSASLAYEGLQREFKSGNVTMTDVLTGQAKLIDANANKYQATHDKLAAQVGLLVSLGNFQATSLRLPVTLYDPEQHLREVQYQRFGLD